MKNEELDFICPICKKVVDKNIDNMKDDDELDITIDPDTNKFYHITCLNKND